MTGEAVTGPLARVWEDLRPLDPLRSITAKLGVLIVSSAVLIAALEYVAVVLFGWRIRYGLAAATVVALLLTRVLAHGLTSPLRQMTRATRDLAAGRVAGPVRATSRDEVGELARAFGAMARELESADRQRRELLANVSHELRTPVAALRAQTENLVDGVRAPDGAALAELLGQVESLGRLLDDLLDLARVDGGVVPLRRAPVPLAPLMDDVVRQARAAHPSTGIDVRITPPGLVVDADRHRLRQVVTNLLDNAARHGAGTVLVAAGGAGGGLVLEVTDDGPGIPPERWDTVFERFRGGTGEIPLGPPGRAGARPDGGTGLGLAIARWAVALHGGRIGVAESPTGCRIRVELPTSTESPESHHRIAAPPA